MNLKSNIEKISTVIYPDRHLTFLSKSEISRLLDTSQGGLYRLMRNCCLAVLNSGNDTDDSEALLSQYEDFSVRVLQEERGIKLEINNAPSTAFVDGKMIRGIKEHLFSVLRDIVYVNDEIINSPNFDLDSSEGITDAVFHILRNADITKYGTDPRLVVCWGGHSISRDEYEYTKKTGYELGLRGIDICTGCGPGAMKGPMKGATIAHAKQRFKVSRYVGMSEPGIIAAEAPNPIVNDLVIMPDIEKRLEGFVRIGHGIIVFPGGVGTAEEILYLLGILLHPENQDIPFPLVFTGPKSAEAYFQQIDEFIGITLGEKAKQRYKIFVDDPVSTAREMKAGIAEVRDYRKAKEDAYYFNWSLKIDHEFQKPFSPTHENVSKLQLDKNQPVHLLAANLRRVFSAIVAGNVKEEGISAIKQYGKFKIKGDAEIIEPIDELLKSFVAQQRMKLPGTEYIPCYEVIK